MKSLRAREFVAILVAVLVAVGVTLVLAAALVRSSARHEALKSLARQAALIAEQQKATSPQQHELTSLGAFFDTQQERLAILGLKQAALLLPPAGGARAARRKPGAGVGRGRRPPLPLRGATGRRAARSSSCARRSSRRPTSSRTRSPSGSRPPSARRSPPLAAFLLARAVARPVERVSQASLALAAGERPGPAPGLRADRGRHARGVVQQAVRRSRPRQGRRAHVPALGQPRAEDAARRDPRPRRGAPRRRDDRSEGRRRDRAGVEAARPAGPRPARPGAAERALVLRPSARGRPHRASCTRRSSGTEPSRCASAFGSSATRTATRPAVADPDRALQVLSNLIENALRTTAERRDRDRVGARPASCRSPIPGPGLAAGGAAARLRAVLPLQPLRAEPRRRHRPRARDREAAHRGDGRHRLGGERARRAARSSASPFRTADHAASGTDLRHGSADR